MKGLRSFLILAFVTSAVSFTAGTTNAQETVGKAREILLAHPHISCKFGPNCSRDNPDCSEFSGWFVSPTIVLKNAIFWVNAMTMEPLEFDVKNVGNLTVLDNWNEEGTTRLIIHAQTNEAHLSFAFQSPDENNPRLFAGELADGICRTVK